MLNGNLIAVFTVKKKLESEIETSLLKSIINITAVW